MSNGENITQLIHSSEIFSLPNNPDQQFLLFSQCFLPFQKQISNFELHFICHL